MAIASRMDDMQNVVGEYYLSKEIPGRQQLAAAIRLDANGAVGWYSNRMRIAAKMHVWLYCGQNPTAICTLARIYRHVQGHGVGYLWICLGVSEANSSWKAAGRDQRLNI
jgi:hypothetical protein